MKGKIHFGIMEECGSYESPELNGHWMRIV